MLDAITIGEKIAQARKLKNLSQSGLGELLSVSSQAVGKWERGESMPDILTFNRLAETLGVDLNHFSEGFASSTRAAELPDASDPPEAARRGIDMSSSNWKNADFSGLKNLNGKFSFSNITNCKFVGSDLSGITLKGNNTMNCDFTGSNLTESEFRGCNIQRCDFSGANMTSALFKGCNIKNSSFTSAVWNSAEFHGSVFAGLVFDSDMTDCSFKGCMFNKSEFRGVTLLNCFFKDGTPRRAKFTDCRADSLTLAFLKNAKVDVSGITRLDA